MGSKILANLYLSGKSTRQITRYHLIKQNMQIRPAKRVVSPLREKELYSEYINGLNIIYKNIN